MGIQMVKRQKYNDEFKREAVRLMENRGTKSVDAVADDLGVSTSQLYAWRGKFGAAGPGESKGLQAEELRGEVQRLKRELERVSKERELLKNPLPSSSRKMGERGGVHRCGEGRLLSDFALQGRRHLTQSLLSVARESSECSCSPRR